MRTFRRRIDGPHTILPLPGNGTRARCIGHHTRRTNAKTFISEPDQQNPPTHSHHHTYGRTHTHTSNTSSIVDVDVAVVVGAGSSIFQPHAFGALKLEHTHTRKRVSNQTNRMRAHIWRSTCVCMYTAIVLTVAPGGHTTHKYINPPFCEPNDIIHSPSHICALAYSYYSVSAKTNHIVHSIKPALY